jgi:DMSO/TMAO reductase YedYZ molybdopterin-dependent catalytic subunit
MRRSLIFGVLVGGLTSLPLIAISYLAEQVAGLPFVPFDLFDWLTRTLPGQLLTASIDAMVRVIVWLGLADISNAAKRIEQMQALLVVVVGSAIVGLVVGWVVQLTTWPGYNVGLVAGAVVFLLVVVVELSLGNLSGSVALSLLWLAILIVGWGVLLGSLLAAKPLSQAAPDVAAESFRADRRAFLLKLAGGSVGLALAAWSLGRLSGAQQRKTTAGTPPSGAGATPQPLETAIARAPTATPASPPQERIAVAPGTRPEVTPNADFYRIDINTLPPTIDAASWELKVSGLFDRPRTLMLSDLTAYPAVTQPITISCISNPIGGSLIGASYWTGVPFLTVLQDLGLSDQAQEIAIKSVDGFYESVVMEDMMDSRTLLVYGMNGVPLPIEHGFPLRIYIPNHYGMKQPKWITSIEAIDHKGAGYWVDRGWSATAIPRIISIIDTVATDTITDDHVPVGGIAWAGDRGIQKVEVQVDDGEWAEADLRVPPLSPLTWAQWRYNWPMTGGRHTFRVRATDGAGALQIGKSGPAHPDGATGYHSVSATI